MIRTLVSTAVLAAALSSPALAQAPTDAELQERARRVMLRTRLSVGLDDLAWGLLQ